MRKPCPMMMLIRTLSLAMLTAIGASDAAAEALTAAECRQILQTYGVLPASCPKSAPVQTAAAAAPAVAQPAAATAPAAAIPLEAPTQNMRQNNIFFAQGGDTLTSDAVQQLRKLADVLNSPALSRACIMLIGHSDATGSDLINMEVGSKRAATVRNQLALMLSDPDRVEVLKSMGETSPLAGLPATSPWQRRVEIWARDCPGVQP